MAPLATNGFVKGDLVSGILKVKIIQVKIIIDKESNKILTCFCY